MKLLVTGHCGFIGQNFVRLYNNDYNIVGMDKLGYASDDTALDLCAGGIGDLCYPHNIEAIFNVYGPFDAIINFAAESHVDNSIASPKPFMRSNFIGTFNLLEAARKYKVSRFVQIGTDEVYGDLEPEDPPFSNLHELKPSSPYSASKAAADVLVLSYGRTYKMDVVITRSCNNYGPFQHKEKFIPVVIRNALAENKIPLYGDGLNMREWIHVEDNCKGVLAALLKGKSGGIYNLGSGVETTNIDLLKTILRHLDKPESLIEFVTDRKGHDRRYFLDSTISYEELKWKPEISLNDGLKSTIEWFVKNDDKRGSYDKAD